MTEEMLNELSQKPVSSQQLKKSKRTKIALIFISILMIFALGGLVFLAVDFFGKLGIVFNQDGKSSIVITNETDVYANDPDSPGQIQIETTTIPPLASYFGLTLDEMTTALGSGYTLKPPEAAQDATNPDIKQLAVYTFNPAVAYAEGKTSAGTTIPTASIYVSLDESGHIIDIRYTGDLRLYSYGSPECSFDTLMSTEALVMGVLAEAGVTPKDYTYTVPDFAASIVYDNAGSVNPKVTKQTTTISGRTGLENPVAWTITVTYDFGAAGVETTDEYKQAIKTVKLHFA